MTKTIQLTLTKTIQLTLLALFTIFGAANIQSAESQEEASPTQQLYAAINALNVQVVEKILADHPEEADKTSENVQGHNQTPLYTLCSKYYNTTSQEDIATLNQITKALLNAGANPTKVVELSNRELRQDWSVRREPRSSLTLASSMRRIEDFLHTILTFEYPARHPFQINQFDGQGQSARTIRIVHVYYENLLNDTIIKQCTCKLHAQRIRHHKVILTCQSKPTC